MRLVNRLQILLDDERHERLKAVAAERGTSVGAVVREAIDRGLGPSIARRRAAGARILNAPTMEVPDVDELRGELDQVRGRRA